MGILKKKTRILVTHDVKFLRSADLILVMDHGKIINRGKPLLTFAYHHLGVHDFLAKV